MGLLRNFAWSLLVISLFSCGSAKKNTVTTVGAEESLAYRSLGNDVATIALTLFTNNTFRLEFRSLGNAADAEETANIDVTGTYETDGQWKVLRFIEPEFSVEALFDPRFSDGNDFELIDSTTVRIHTARETIPIWGITCQKGMPSSP
jgi:hypothetical protein